jgi:hypothetical protein
MVETRAGRTTWTTSSGPTAWTVSSSALRPVSLPRPGIGARARSGGGDRVGYRADPVGASYGEGDEHTISDLELGNAKSPCEKTVAKLAWGLRLEGSVKDRFVAVPEGCP